MLELQISSLLVGMGLGGVLTLCFLSFIALGKR